MFRPEVVLYVYILQKALQIKEDKKATDSKDIHQYTQALVLKLQQQIATESKLSSIQDRIEEVIELVGLTPEVRKKIGQLSKGYQQRVGIAAAILHNPEVLILDEPTTGLDPNQLQEIRGLIKELGKEKTILFSTHIMQEVEAVCDRVIIINKGNLLIDKPLQELKSTQMQTIEVTFDTTVDRKLLQKLSDLKSSSSSNNATWQLTFDTKKDMRPIIFDFAKENGLKTLELNSQNQSLETLFKEITGAS